MTDRQTERVNTQRYNFGNWLAHSRNFHGSKVRRGMGRKDQVRGASSEMVPCTMLLNLNLIFES